MRQKSNNFKPALERPSPSVSGVVSPDSAFAAAETRVRQLMANTRHKIALEQAKELYKIHRSPASEALLIDAYLGRIQDLIAQNLTGEAESLLALVRERYPAAVPRLSGLALLTAARAGKLDRLLTPLNDPELPAEERTAIELTIEEQVTDLAALAACAALPPEHSLRRAAVSLYQAFQAVTMGPAADEVLTLPEVSRRNPLAPWKMLIWSIASFYRRDDEASRRYLDAIKPAAAAARLVPALRCLLDGRAGEPLAPANAELVTVIKGDAESLKRSIERLDHAFATAEQDSAMLDAVRAAVQACRRNAPSQLERLKQHISVRAAMEELDVEKTRAAMGGPAQHDAYFHRLFACGMEQESDDPAKLMAACTIWNDFRLQAVKEGWFAANSAPVAVLYLHMAKLLAGVPAYLIRSFEQANRRGKVKLAEDLFFIYPEKLYERACVLDPHSDAFSQWLQWAKGVSEPEAGRVAEAWHKICPQDIEPLLHLMATYEERRAFPTALRYLTQAERIDGLNPEVRRARLRLMAGNTIRCIQGKKPDLAERNLQEFSALPQTQQGDRPAFVAALRWMIASLQGNLARAQGYRSDIERLLESRAAAGLLVFAVATECKRSEFQKLEPVQKLSKEERNGVPLALIRLVRLAKDVQFPLRIPADWQAEAAKQFKRMHQTLDVGQLRTLGEAALQSGDSRFVYAIAAAGLDRGGATEAEFLFLRAQSLPAPNFERRMVSAAAAAILARQQGQQDLAGKARDFLRGPFKDGSIELTQEQVGEVLQTEKGDKTYPKAVRQGSKSRSIAGGGLCPCPECRRERGERGDGFDEFFADFEDEEDDFDMDELLSEVELPEGMPPEIAEILLGEVARALNSGETIDEVLSRLSSELGAGSEKRRKGRRK